MLTQGAEGIAEMVVSWENFVRKMVYEKMFDEGKGQRGGEERPGGVWRGAKSLVLQEWVSSDGVG